MFPKKGTPEYGEWILTPEYKQWRIDQKERMQRITQDPIWQQNHREALQKIAKDPLWQEKIKIRSADPEFRNKVKIGSQRRSQDLSYKYNFKKAMQKLAQDPIWLIGQKENAIQRSQNPEWRRKNKKSAIEVAQRPEWKLKMVESKLGGFWYGNVRDNGRKYCELWNKSLWKRIDAFWDYKSSLSGLTKEDNRYKALSRHHVYWQPKACCEWDEDKQGYYAWINIGTNWKPNWYKHYINGDPNKFVLLTSKEHGIVSKDKLKWIKIFEDIIEQRGGKSYYTKEEMEKLYS